MVRIIPIIPFFLHITDTCSLPSNTGPCRGAFPRWFYNSSSDSCELFIYGGCGGNTNRFTSLQQCIQSCGALMSICFTLNAL